MRKTAISLTALLGAALIAPTPAAAEPRNDSQALRDAVTVDGLMRHTRAFQRIAETNGNSRASGTTGYDRSASYVSDLLTSAGLRVTQQEFTFTFYKEVTPAVVAQVSPTPRNYAAFTADYSPTGDVTGAIVPTNDILIPPGATPSSSSSGCEAADFIPASPSQRQIALVQRGTCDYRTKVINAAAAGYDAVIIFNEGQPGRQDAIPGTLSEPAAIPATLVSYASGAELYAAAQGGTAVGRVATTTEIRPATTRNVFAETVGGNANEVVIAGAHLDSVAKGPGVNDNGSGVAALLEIAVQSAKLQTTTRQKMRFAFWGAEEFGSLGAQHYVDSLSSAQLASISAYLNFDMLGSANFVRFLYDGDGSETGGAAGPAGSATIETTFANYFAAQRLPVKKTAFEFRSDYGPFFDAGVPVGGVHSGFDGLKTAEEAAIFGGTVGAQYDPCYHQACDNLGNVNTTVLHQLADAAAHSIVTLAWAAPVARTPQPARSSIDRSNGTDA
ncbi:M20/M25/M40 family metallo-hydrolase [Asanoa siamensis]|uniref:Amidohydrolase n=1 Tax=Asanoa siamensis TaxID=926357 RepID=A0ABQ4D0A7_9ACTN|nr:M20/M25/M40 family metallo-hydrolase [Asanoa siamensis]GIF76981.1 amidohydrolase [Asanoa siamensis]